MEETKSTLQFAARAKLVKTHAVVNEVVNDAVLLKRLQKELADLKEKQKNDASAAVPANQELIESRCSELQSQLEMLQSEKAQQQVICPLTSHDDVLYLIL